jgi:hypothetical protein
MIEMMLLATPGQIVPRHGEDRSTGSMQARDRLACEEESLVCLWQRLVATLGIHTARVLLHRALQQMAHVCCLHLGIRPQCKKGGGSCPILFPTNNGKYAWPTRKDGKYAMRTTIAFCIA